MNKKQAKNRIKAINIKQKVNRTVKQITELMTPVFGQTQSEAAAGVIKKLSNKQLKLIHANPKSFEGISPSGDLARLATDELVGRALLIEEKH